MPMDISYDLSYLSFLGIHWEPRAMMSWDLTKHKIKHTDDYSQRGLSNGSRDLTMQIIKSDDDYSHRGLSNSSRDFTMQMIEPNDDNGSRDLIEEKIKHNDNPALIAATTLQVPFHFRGSTSKEGYEQHSTMRSLIISCNSLVFIASVGVIAFLLPEFPLKPLSCSTILGLFGVYMFQLNEIMPNGALALFFISSPILLVGICRQALWLCKPKTHLSTSGDVSSR
ncbi:hypothetical protein ACSBR1_007156 [Camellia fascicularis]